jgi:hypothetical protein
MVFFPTLFALSFSHLFLNEYYTGDKRINIPDVSSGDVFVTACRFELIFFQGNGGGISVSSNLGNCTVQDCAFVNISTYPSLQQWDGGYGGAMLIDTSNSTIVRNCGFYCHAVYMGGFVQMGGNFQENSSRCVRECTIYNPPLSLEFAGSAAVTTDKDQINVSSVNFTLCNSTSVSALWIKVSKDQDPSQLIGSFLWVVSNSGGSAISFDPVPSTRSYINSSVFVNNTVMWAVVWTWGNPLIISDCAFSGNGMSGYRVLDIGCPVPISGQSPPPSPLIVIYRSNFTSSSDGYLSGWCEVDGENKWNSEPMLVPTLDEVAAVCPVTMTATLSPELTPFPTLTFVFVASSKPQETIALIDSNSLQSEQYLPSIDESLSGRLIDSSSLTQTVIVNPSSEVQLSQQLIVSQFLLPSNYLHDTLLFAVSQTQIRTIVLQSSLSVPNSADFIQTLIVPDSSQIQ